jgi:hypothetical protein
MRYKNEATRLVSNYFQQVVKSDYRFNHETFTIYEEIAKLYAVLFIVENGNKQFDKKRLIEEIKGL